MNAAAEAEGSFRLQLLGGHRAADVNVIPGGAFQQDVMGLIADLALGAAHYAGDRERPGSIADQHGEGIHGPVGAIQGGQALAWGGGTRVQQWGLATSAFDQHIVVESMQGLAQFQHNVVGGIHNSIDRAHACQAQPALHGIGTGGDGHIADQPQGEARVELAVLDSDLNLALNGRPAERELAGRLAQRLPGKGGQLAGHAQHTGVACQVGQDGDIQDGIAHVIDQGHAGGSICVEEDDAFVLFGDSQLFLGTDH